MNLICRILVKDNKDVMKLGYYNVIITHLNYDVPRKVLILYDSLLNEPQVTIPMNNVVDFYVFENNIEQSPVSLRFGLISPQLKVKIHLLDYKKLLEKEGII